MELETAGVETPEAEVASTEVTVENSEATTEQQSEAAKPESGDDEAAAPRKKPGVHNRIDELTRQKHEALREAEYWRQKAAEANATDLEALDYDDQLVAKVRRAERQERADAAQATVETVVERQFTELEIEARAKWADYDAVTRNPHVPITPAMLEVIKESELGPELAYHFGKNPAEAAKLAALPERQLAREIGRLEARFSAPKAPAKQPPEPVQPVSGIRAGGSKDPAAMTMAEYAAWRKATT